MIVKKRSVMFLVPILVVSGLLFVILIFTYINPESVRLIVPAH